MEESTAVNLEESLSDWKGIIPEVNKGFLEWDKDLNFQSEDPAGIRNRVRCKYAVGMLTYRDPSDECSRLYGNRCIVFSEKNEGGYCRL